MAGGEQVWRVTSLLARGGILRAWVLLAVCVSAGAALQAYDSDPVEVDMSVALRIGDFEVTRYVVDKNYNLFVASQPGSKPRPDEVEAWFRVFLAQQTIKSRLQREGYLERADVREAVDRMTRYMLSQPNGPFYESLYRNAPLPPERVAVLRKASLRVIDAVLVRFDDEALANTVLGGPATDQERGARLKALGTRSLPDGVDHIRGEVRWPYHPFQEIMDDLAEAKPGESRGPLIRALGVYYFLVQGERLLPAPAADSAVAFARYVRDLDNLSVRRVRQHRILKDSRLAIDPSALSAFTEVLLAQRGRPSELGEPSLGPVADLKLAVYSMAGESREVTGRHLWRHLKAGVLRPLPTNAAEVAASIRERVMEEYDVADARQAGIDQRPKFVQDRLNFALNQALAAFEHESLAPRLAPTDEALRTFHASRLPRYSESAETAGTLYVYRSAEDAAAGVERLRAGDDAGAFRLAERVVDPCPVARTGPPVFPEVPNAALIALPVGRSVGPLAYGNRPAVFVNRAPGPRRPRPLAEIRDRVRQEWLRARLDEMEVELAQKEARRTPVQVSFDLRSYGVEDPQRILGTITFPASDPKGPSPFPSGVARAATSAPEPATDR